MPVKFYFLLSFALLAMLSCQPNAPQTTTPKGLSHDTLQYEFSRLERELPCTKDSSQSCLTISIEKVTLLGGSSETALKNMEQSLSQALESTDNSDQSARNPEQIADNLEEEYLRIVKEMPDYQLPWHYKRNYNVYLNRNGIFGTQLNAYSFTGGAHGANFIYYFNFDIDSGKQMILTDLILPKKMKLFMQMAEAQFRESRMIDSSTSYSEAGFWFKDDVFKLNENFKYSPQGLEFLYNPYEIAPYSEGAISLIFPYDAIENSIAAEYRFLTKNNNLR